MLVVEDSETDAKLMIRALRASGLSPTWERVDSSRALREALERRRWEVVLSDSSLPGLGALEALAVSKELAPTVPFILVSGVISEDLVVEVMRRGAADCMTKDRMERLGPVVAREVEIAVEHARLSEQFLAARELEARRAVEEQYAGLLTALRVALEAAARGRASARAEALARARDLVERALSELRVRAAPRQEGGETAADSKRELTPRQREVLRLVVEGHSTKAIAERLKISVKTVETHRADVMRRLGIHNVAGLVHYAIRCELFASRG